jgi:hypothetical protein
MLIILGKWANAVIRTSTDDLGRWSTATINGQDGRAVTIYSVYNVVKTTIKVASPATVFAQQWQLLRLSGVLILNPRKQTIDDLNDDIQRRRNNQGTVIIVGDLNEQISDDPNLIASTCAQFNLFDALEYHHGDTAMVPTYICGSKRLDYGILQQELQPFLLASGLNMFNECVYSDHRASFLDINLRAYLGDCVPKLAPVQQRSVSSKSQSVDRFVSKVYSHQSENKVLHQYQEFLLDVDGMDKPWVQANKLDDMLGQALATAEKHCAVRPAEPWSAKLHIASRKVRYWKTMLTQRFTGTTQDRVLAELADEVWSRHPHLQPPPTTMSSVKWREPLKNPLPAYAVNRRKNGRHSYKTFERN